MEVIDDAFQFAFLGGLVLMPPFGLLPLGPPLKVAGFPTSQK